MLRKILVLACICVSPYLNAQDEDLSARVEEHVKNASLNLERPIPTFWAWIVNSTDQDLSELREVAIEKQKVIEREQRDGFEELKALGMTENDRRFDAMELALVKESQERMAEMQGRFFSEQIESLSKDGRNAIASRYLIGQLRVFGSRILAEREISTLLCGKELVDKEGRKNLVSQLQEEGSKITKEVLDAQVKASEIKVEGVTLIEHLTHTLEMVDR